MRGFSLIETLVAVVILVSAVVGPLTLAQRSIRSAVYARDQVLASFLAEEAIEYIRSIRDSNKHAGESWLNGLSNCLGRLCVVDTTQAKASAFVRCGKIPLPPYASACEPLGFNKVNGKYGFKDGVDWEDTRFVREVTIATIPNGDRPGDKEAEVRATVRWQTGNLPVRDIVMRAYIYDW